MAEGACLGFMDDAILRSDLALLETISEQVEVIEEKIAALAAEDQRVRLLMTMTGIGYFTAMLILTKVGDVGWFRGDKAFAPWMGLAPSVHQSARANPNGAFKVATSHPWSISVATLCTAKKIYIVFLYTIFM